MRKVAWLTDIHLNFAQDPSAAEFLRQVRASDPDAVLLGGDISESHDLLHYLGQIEEQTACPVFFVLGNHDYYFGSIADVRRQVREFCAVRPRMRYLTQESVLELASDVGLVGHDGWADARLGDYVRSYVMMNDYKLIAELAPYDKQSRRAVLQEYGDAAADHIRHVLPAALERYPRVVLLTHIPPLREACWHEGRISDDEWAPHFTCKALGDAILEIAPAFPDRRLTVLCGHTHGEGETHPLPNVQILTGGAEYGRPRITRMLEME